MPPCLKTAKNPKLKPADNPGFSPVRVGQHFNTVSDDDPDAMEAHFTA
jgi:hypothetical protein